MYNTHILFKKIFLDTENFVWNILNACSQAKSLVLDGLQLKNANTFDMSFTIFITWSGRTTTISLPVADPALDELGMSIEKQLGASFETIKLLVPGRKGYIAPATQKGQMASAAGLTDGCKALLLASNAEDVTNVRAATDLPGMRGFEDELKRAARRRQTARSGDNPQPPRAEYTFAAYEAWQRPGLHPPPAEALKLLYRLANDPGIMGIMATHCYRVGLLSEMPPEGKVGISPMCILGVNINAGQEISLRLRTDDLKGFRKYERIRETLIHELAHMEFGEHDNNFKQLNSLLARECATINARFVGGHSLLADNHDHFLASAAYAGGATSRRHSELDDPSLLLDGVGAVMAATARSSGKTLRQLAKISGHGAAAAAKDTPTAATTAGKGITAGVAVAAAAPQPSGDGRSRMEGALLDDSGGGDGGERDVDAHAADRGVRGCSSSGADGGGEASEDGALRKFEHFDAVTERAEAAARRLGTMEDAQGHKRGIICIGVGGDGGDHKGRLGGEGFCAVTTITAAVRASSSALQPATPAQVEPERELAEHKELTKAAETTEVTGMQASATLPVSSAATMMVPANSLNSASAAVADVDMDVDVGLADGVTTVRKSKSNRMEVDSTPHTKCGDDSVMDQGTGALDDAHRSDRSESVQRQALPTQPPQPPIRLALRPLEELSTATDGGLAAAAQTKLRQAWDALAQLVAAAMTTEDVATALDTLETMLGNAIHFPTEDRYRRIRLGNAVFQRRLGWLPGGVEFLRVAGFVEEVVGEDAVLRLRRNDPGLLWLVLSAVREAREQVTTQLSAGTGEK
ncbi:hypothetical protein Vretifemale_18701 [Volvox reticuliferus]|uniref:WLM domain-containing protein n=2 Tax=Volvox reticuliferus TaxID=1737510 RepID=A0A8J4CXZ4_9CHLO|nr:hypothetical protein Vretifemale_18701 [Volvox reticuliferus]